MEVKQKMSFAMKAKKCIGIITGSGPDAGIDLWQKILLATRQQLADQYQGDLDAPEVLIHSVPTLGLSMELETHDAQVWEVLRATVARMDEHVEAYVIACNTLNYYAPQLAALGLRARLVSAQEVVQQFIQSRQLSRIALLGSRPVMEMSAWSAYRELGHVVDLELPSNIESLHQILRLPSNFQTY
jgi:aspartate racemase